MQLQIQAKDKIFHQADLTSTDIACYEYMFNLGHKTYENMNIFVTVDVQSSQCTIHEKMFYK